MVIGIHLTIFHFHPIGLPTGHGFVSMFVVSRLQFEVREIRESMRMLEDQLRTAERTMSKLVKSRTTLERDIAIKETSIQIDFEMCANLRKSLARIEPGRTGPSFSMSLVS